MSAVMGSPARRPRMTGFCPGTSLLHGGFLRGRVHRGSCWGQFIISHNRAGQASAGHPAPPSLSKRRSRPAPAHTRVLADVTQAEDGQGLRFPLGLGSRRAQALGSEGDVTTFPLWLACGAWGSAGWSGRGLWPESQAGSDPGGGGLSPRAHSQGVTVGRTCLFRNVKARERPTLKTDRTASLPSRAQRAPRGKACGQVTSWAGLTPRVSLAEPPPPACGGWAGGAASVLQLQQGSPCYAGSRQVGSSASDARGAGDLGSSCIRRALPCQTGRGEGAGYPGVPRMPTELCLPPAGLAAPWPP